jgi:hypothetical protein
MMPVVKWSSPVEVHETPLEIVVQAVTALV